MKRTVGDFLLDRLSQIGINNIFGVPGDYNLQFLMQVEKREDIRFVGNRNELNGAYTADGYARLAGVSALLTTYGVGDLSALNGVAGAFAEYVPVICMSGAPPLYSIRQRALLHHTTAEGNYEDVMESYRPFTVACTRITPQNAVEEVDRVLQACVREKRPVYIQIPSDITFFEIEVPDRKLLLDSSSSDPDQLSDLLAYIQNRFKHARKPALLLGNALDRFHLKTATQDFIEKFNIPFATQSSAQAVLDQDLCQWAGCYNGAACSETTRALVEESDCLLGVNVQFTDSNTGHFSHTIPTDMIDIQPFRTFVGRKCFEDVLAIDILTRLVDTLSYRNSEHHVSFNQGIRKNWHVKDEQKQLTLDRFWAKMGQFIQPDDVIVADAGTSMRGVRASSLPSGITIVNQPLWLSIGYSLPALFGSLMAASDRRQLLFIGDGSFQLTAQETSAFFTYDLKPVIFLINNNGYTIERSIMGMRSPFNDIPQWNYRQLFDALSGGKPYFYTRMGTEGELESNLQLVNAHSHQLCLVEVMIDAFDIPKNVQQSADRIAAFNYGEKGLKILKDDR